MQRNKGRKNLYVHYRYNNTYFAPQLLEGKDVGLFIHRGPLYGRAGKGAWEWESGPLVSGMSEGPVDHRDGFSCSEKHGTLKDCLVNSFQSPCVNVAAVLLASRVVCCLRHFLTGPHLLMWQFILSGCLLFHPNVLAGQRLVYDESRRVSAHLIPSAAGGGGDDCVHPGEEGFVAESHFPWDRSLKCFFFLETWWELCILSRTVTFLDLERATTKSADQPIRFRSEKTGSHSC